MKDYFLPQAQYSKVKIFYSLGCLNGFKFYDSDDKLIFKIGQTKSEYSCKNFLIAADEEPPRLSFEFSVFGSDPTRRGISAVYELNPQWRVIGRVGETGTFRGLLHYLIRFR